MAVERSRDRPRPTTEYPGIGVAQSDDRPQLPTVHADLTQDRPYRLSLQEQLPARSGVPVTVS